MLCSTRSFTLYDLPFKVGWLEIGLFKSLLYGALDSVVVCGFDGCKYLSVNSGVDGKVDVIVDGRDDGIVDGKGSVNIRQDG